MLVGTRIIIVTDTGSKCCKYLGFLQIIRLITSADTLSHSTSPLPVSSPSLDGSLSGTVTFLSIHASTFQHPDEPVL